MDIDVGYYNGSPQVIKKRIDTGRRITGVFKQPYSLMNPVVQIQDTMVFEGLRKNDYNYMVIDGKSYYVTGWEAVQSKLVEVRLHLDVLRTYQNQILNMNVMLDRSSSSSEKDIADSMYPLSAGKNYSVKEFPRAFSDKEDQGTYVLVAAQSGYTPV